MHAAMKTDARPKTAAPSVWVGCLGCYRAERLVGSWFVADDCPTTITDFESRGIYRPWPHFAEVHDELWVFDHENFEGTLTGECSPEHARRLASLIKQAEDRGVPTEALAFWLSDGHGSSEPDDLLDDIQDAYCGHYNSGADYAQALAEDFGAVTQGATWPLSCIDWERAWRELECGGDNYAIPAADGGSLIFRGC